MTPMIIRSTKWTHQRLGGRVLPFPGISAVDVTRFVCQGSKSNKKAVGSCKISVFLCEMTCNQAQLSSFVSGKLSSGPLFS
jgi:hypothetical protein